MLLGRVFKQLLSRRFRFRRTTLAAAYALYEQGRLEEARRACGAIAGAPAAEVAWLRGVIARKQGDLEAAAAAMGEAVARRENEPNFCLTFGEVLAELRRYEHALVQFDAAVEHSGEDAALRESALVAAGRSAAALDDPNRAADYFQRALALAPGNVGTSELLAAACYQASRIEDARIALEAPVRARRPGLSLRRALLLPAVYESQAHIDAVRERLSRDLDDIVSSPQPHADDPVGEVGITAFRLAYHNRNNTSLLAKLCAAARSVYPAEGRRELPRRPRGGAVRVGFVSTFFHHHSIGRTTIGLIRDLPRDRFTVCVFAISPAPDRMRRAIAEAADEYHELPRRLDDVRRAIEGAQLDVLLFADIGMHPLTYFLALWRLAPVQLVTWGHPETTGIDTIDYYLSAKGVEIGSAQTHYTERLIQPDVFYLPGYERASLARPIGREELGLPRDTRLYACLQTLFKLHPDFDAVLVSILDRDPAGEVLLIGSPRSDADLLRERFKRTLGAAAARVRFLDPMPQERYLATVAAADVALDPLYFGGNNSSCEALALGVPLVTLPGDHLYGRYTFALYREMGLDDCIVHTFDEYAQVACRIACDSELRRSISREIADRSRIVFERKDITLAYADFFEEIVAAS